MKPVQRKTSAKKPAASQGSSKATRKASSPPAARPPAPAKAKAIRKPAPAPAAKVKAIAPKRPAAPRKTKAPSRPRMTQPAAAPVEIPSILLEGDLPVRTAMSGPGRRYALGPQPPAEPEPISDAGELPAAYGTRRLIAAARDPHWIYVHWDLTDAQQREYNADSADGRLVIRMHRDAVTSQPHTELQVHPESRNWFVHVGLGGVRFIAELGYYEHGRDWVQVATSHPTLTPPDAPASEEAPIQFATIPAECSFQELLALIQMVISENVPLAEALEQLRASGHPDLPSPEDFLSRPWTPAQEAALANTVYLDQERRVWIGSLEITELLRRRLEHGVSSAGVSAFSAGPGPGASAEALSSISHVSSPHGGLPRPRSFWFNINTEVIVYGATDPQATVVIGDRPIRLRPDGTFSFRFALPDGQHSLPVTAHSPDGVESRSADLSFARTTLYRGEVGAHPQDPRLKNPAPSNVH